MTEQRIRAIVFKEDEWWVIQVLDYDLATQVRRLEDVPDTFRRLILGQMEVNTFMGVAPFHGFSKAPRRFWEMYEKAHALVAPTLLGDVDGEASPEVEARLAA